MDAQGNVYVADHNGSRIQKFTGYGDFLCTWGNYGTQPGEFRAPMDVAIDAQGRIFIDDLANHRIQVFGYQPVPNHGIAWGELKARYR